MYAQAVEPAMLHNLLTGHRLLIVTEPGAQSSVVSGITAAAIHAGATVTGQINLQPKFFDTSGTAQDSLNQTTLAVAQPTGLQLDASATYQQQAAQLIASEILTGAPGSTAGGGAGGPGTPAPPAPGRQAPPPSPIPPRPAPPLDDEEKEGKQMRRAGCAVAAGACAAGAARLAYSAMSRRPPGGPKPWSRTNHRGEPVTLLEGPAVAAGAVAGVLAQGVQ